MLDPKPTIKLTGEDGNAFGIIGRCVRVLRKEGATPEQIKEFQDDAMSGDYDHVLQTCFK